MDIKVYKNFMDNLLFINLKENIENSQFAWFKSGIVPEIEDIQLIHTFFLSLIKLILNILNYYLLV